MKTKAPEKTEKHIAFNNHIPSNLFFIAFGSLMISFGLWIDELIFAVMGAVLVLGFVVVIMVSATHYIFSKESVVICHPFNRKETICWEDIRSINKYGTWINTTGLGLPHYKIYYRHEKEVIFLNGEICRSRRTKKLLQKYYKGTVE